MNFRILCLAVILVSPLAAEVPHFKTKIITLATEREVGDAYFLNQGQVVQFNAVRSGFGQGIDYNGPPRLILRSKPEEFTAKKAPAPVAAVDLPVAAGMVLLVAERDKADKFRLRAYDISNSSFRAGDYKVFNFSDSVTSLIVGDRRFALRPGENQSVSNPTLRARTLDILVEIAEVKDGVAKRVYASAWGHQAAKRNFVFLLNGSHPTRPIAIRRFSDYVE